MCNFHASNSHPCLDLRCVSCTRLLYLLNNGKGSPGQMARGRGSNSGSWYCGLPATTLLIRVESIQTPRVTEPCEQLGPFQGAHLSVNPSVALTCPSPWEAPALSFLFQLNLYYFGEAEVGEEKNPQILLKKLRNVKIFSSGQCELRGLLYGSTIHI